MSLFYPPRFSIIVFISDGKKPQGSRTSKLFIQQVKILFLSLADTDNQLIDPASGTLHYFHPSSYPVVSTEKFLQRIVEYMRRLRLQSIRSERRGEGRDRTHFQRRRNELSFSRLACAVSPDQTRSILLYAQLCLDLDVQLDDAVRLLQQVILVMVHNNFE